MEPALGHAAEKDADDEKHGRAVEEDDRQVGQAQEPGTEKGMIPSECFLGIGIYPAGDGAASHQVGEVTGNNQHDDHADRHGNHGPCRSRDREEGVAGHGKHAPADHAAEGHPPHVEFGQVAVQGFRWRKLVHVASHHAESMLQAPKHGSPEVNFIVTYFTGENNTKMQPSGKSCHRSRIMVQSPCHKVPQRQTADKGETK